MGRINGMEIAGRGIKGAISKNRIFPNNFSKRSCTLLMFKIGLASYKGLRLDIRRSQKNGCEGKSKGGRIQEKSRGEMRSATSDPSTATRNPCKHKDPVRELEVCLMSSLWSCWEREGGRRRRKNLGPNHHISHPREWMFKYQLRLLFGLRKTKVGLPHSQINSTPRKQKFLILMIW